MGRCGRFKQESKAASKLPKKPDVRKRKTQWPTVQEPDAEMNEIVEPESMEIQNGKRKKIVDPHGMPKNKRRLKFLKRRKQESFVPKKKQKGGSLKWIILK